MSRGIVLALFALATTPAAALDFGEYSVWLQTDGGRERARWWLDGFGRGVGNYEAHQAMDNKARRFCPPRGTPFSPELLAGIVAQTIDQQPTLAKATAPVEAIIWMGLERSFPCKPSVSG